MYLSDPTIWIALAAGLLSFISPCCLPLYPSYISYITGISVSELRSEKRTMSAKAVLHTVFFMIGFSIVFISLGFAASLIGSLFDRYQDLIRQLGGIFVIVMGLFMLGFFQNSFLNREKRLSFATKPAGYFGSVLVGIAFAAGWTPCMGPILSSMVALSASHPTKEWLFVAYTLGFSVPFFIMSFFVGKIKWFLRYAHVIMKAGGALLIVTGILLYTDQMSQILIWFSTLFGGFRGF